MTGQPFTDPVADVEVSKPAELQAAAVALEPYVAITDIGISLDAPQNVSMNLDAEVVTALHLAVKLTNELETVDSGMAPASV